MTDYQPANDLLKERVVLVSGADTDIGCCAAKIYAKHGATVVLVGGHVKELETTYDAIGQAGGLQPAIFPLKAEDATLNSYSELFHVVEKEFGTLDGLLHANQRLGELTTVDHLDPEEWNKVLYVNVTSPFLLTQACLPLLRKADKASIIFSTDKLGQHGKAYWGGYGVSMAGVENLMQTLADELETNTNIRVNSIDPGAIQSAIRRSAYPGEDIRKLPTPDAVIMKYLYLMGDDSASISCEHFKAQEIE